MKEESNMKTKKKRITTVFRSLLCMLCTISLWSIPIKAEEALDFTWDIKQPIQGETITFYGPETYRGEKIVGYNWDYIDANGNYSYADKDIKVSLPYGKITINLKIETENKETYSATKEIIVKKGRASASLFEASGEFKKNRNQFDTDVFLRIRFQAQYITIENVIFKIDDVELGKIDSLAIMSLQEFYIIKDVLNVLETGEHPISITSTGNDDYWGLDTLIDTIHVYGVKTLSIASPPVSIEKGNSEQLQANVDVYESEQFPVHQDVEWKLENNTSSDTKLVDGLLSVGLDETAPSLKVTATSTFDTSISDEIEIQVVDQTHDVKPGSSTQIKNGENGLWEFEGKYEEVSEVSLDGKAFRIEPMNNTSAKLYMDGYTEAAGMMEEGSVKVTLYEDFIKTLSNGNHTLEVQFQSGTGQTDFEVIYETPPVIEPEEPTIPDDSNKPDQPVIDGSDDDRHEVTSNSTVVVENETDGFWEFTGNYHELIGISLDGEAFRIEPINNVSANLYMNGYQDIAGRIEEGSVKITLYYDFLKTLENGSHAIEVKFETNGDPSYGETSFEINIKDEPSIEPEKPEVEEPKQEPEPEEPKQEPEIEQPIQKPEITKPKETKVKEEKVVKKEVTIKDTASSEVQLPYGYIGMFIMIGAIWILNKKRYMN